MQVILTQSVAKLGRGGSLVAVPDGFARNFLIPRGLARLATPEQISRLERQRARELESRQEQDVKTRQLAERLPRTPVTIPVKVNQHGKLFGSLTADQIVAGLERQGVVGVRSEAFVLPPHHIDTVGDHRVEVKLSPAHTTYLTVTLTADDVS